MSPMILSLLTFLAVALGVAGAYSIFADLFLRDRTRVNSRVDDEFRKKQRIKAEKSNLFRNLGKVASEIEAESAEHRTIAERFAMMIEQSGMDITARQVLTMSAVIGVSLALVGGVVGRSPWWAVGLLLVGAIVPPLYVRHKKHVREERLRAQLPDAFDLMARVMRAGQTMSQALLAVADEFTPPIAAEFSYCYEQQNLGLPPEVSYADLARRNDLIEIKLFVLALLVQQQTGGNLAELLDKLSGVLRERARIRGVVHTLTAEGRMQAMILMALPFVIFLMMMVLNPVYAKQLFNYPKLIMMTLGSEALGALWIRKIVNFQY